MSHCLRPTISLFALGFVSAAGAGVYTGRLVDIDGAPKAGVSVSYKSGADVLGTVATGADGTWSLEPGTGVVREARIRLSTGNLVVDGNRQLRVAFGDRDLSGRAIRAVSAVRAVPSTVAPRVQAAIVPDTLVYSIGDKIILRDTISAASGSGIDRIFDTTWNAAIVYGHLKDARDNNLYRTVKVGTQVWMAQNLAFKRDTSWRNRDSLQMERRYGRMYQWSAAMDTSGENNSDIADLPPGWRGICPAGWHVPSDAEWSTLVNFADSANSGAGLRSLHYPITDTAVKALDTWGFRVLAGGQVAQLTTYPYTYVYRAFGTNGMFWTATEVTTTKSYVRNFGQTANYSTRVLYPKNEGYSVRCIMD